MKKSNIGALLETLVGKLPDPMKKSLLMIFHVKTPQGSIRKAHFWNLYRALNFAKVYVL